MLGDRPEPRGESQTPHPRPAPRHSPPPRHSRESGNPATARAIGTSAWMPACAGMTKQSHSLGSAGIMPTRLNIRCADTCQPPSSSSAAASSGPAPPSSSRRMPTSSCWRGIPPTSSPPPHSPPRPIASNSRLPVNLHMSRFGAEFMEERAERVGLVRRAYLDPRHRGRRGAAQGQPPDATGARRESRPVRRARRDQRAVSLDQHSGPRLRHARPGQRGLVRRLQPVAHRARGGDRPRRPLCGR